MRLKKASITFAGAAAAVALTTMAASPAWACNDRDPALKLNSACGKAGAPDWMVSNPNGWGAVPFTWSDDKGGHSDGKLTAPANGSVALPTHASKIIVIAYRPDMRDLPVWKNHGAAGVLHCMPNKPSTPPSHQPSHKPTAEPTSESPQPTPPPAGEAGPATPVKAQPQFTG
ncbi:MAG: hypothetical protein ACRDP6_32845 [Actinoallomurus sp.]